MSAITEASSASKTITKLNGIATREKWSVPRVELSFLDKGEVPFAKGSSGKLFRAKWRGLTCAVKTIHFKHEVSITTSSRLLCRLRCLVQRRRGTCSNSG